MNDNKIPTPLEALAALNQLARAYKGTADEHENISMAVNIIRDAITPKDKENESLDNDTKKTAKLKDVKSN